MAGSKTVNGVIWSFIDKFSSSFINFAFNILIARILLPSDYGMVAMLGIFLSICNCFIDSGFTNALIYKQDRTDKDFCTMFWFNILVALLSYALLFFAAPLISDFYHIPQLTTVTRLTGLNLVIGSLSCIQNARLSIVLDFRKKSLISLSSALVSGAVGLWLAKAGYGVLALVFQGLTLTACKAALLWLTSNWRLRLMFCYESFKSMFSFGSKLLVTNLIDTVYNNMYPLVLGKFYSAGNLGFYSRAESLGQFPSAGVSGIIQNVSYPVLARLQNDMDELMTLFRKFIRLTAYFVFPIMVGLSCVADPFIRILLTDKWAASIPLLRLLSIGLMSWPVLVLSSNLLQAIGRTDYTLKLETIKKAFGVLVLAVTINFGLTAVASGGIVTSVFAYILNSHYTHKATPYGLKEHISDIIRPLLLSFAMAPAVFMAMSLVSSLWWKLILGVMAGAAFYILGSKLLHFRELPEVVAIIKSKL